MRRLILVMMVLTAITMPMHGQRKDLSGLKFCIDPGHGGHSSNDRPPVFAGLPFWESDGNYEKALLLKPLLEARGATVILTRYTNEYTNDSNGGDDEPSLSARYTVANQNNVNWFHSIHSNATGGNNASTNYTLILLKENVMTRQAQWPEALVMSDRLWKQIQAHHLTSSAYWVRTDYTFYGGPNGGYNLGVMNGAAMPCELSEGSFHDYQPETRRLLNNDYRKDEAYAIYNAFLDYFGAPFDTTGIVRGTQTDPATGNGVNNVVARLLPVNKVYNGDAYGNGYFFFDNVPPGDYTVRYETPGYTTSDAAVTIMNTTPVVGGSNPVADAMGVPRISPFAITFLRSMDTANVRSMMTITPAIAGTITWSQNNTVMTYTPSVPMPFKTQYTVGLNLAAKTPPSLVYVANGVVSVSALTIPYRFSFTTENLPPNITLTQPKQNEPAFVVTKPIALRFTETMDTTITQKSFSIKPAVDGVFSWTNNMTNLFFTPVKPLPYSTNFMVTIDSSAKSRYGGRLDQNQDTVSNDTYILSFRTQDDPTGVEATSDLLPKEFGLAQNYPNPFNPSTTIDVHVARTQQVTVKVYDVLGKETATLVNERLAPGVYSFAFDASSLSSGVYFYRMQAGEFVQTRRLLVQK
jgi:N-acetylmuramoyl-L-alanine amidase